MLKWRLSKAKSNWNNHLNKFPRKILRDNFPQREKKKKRLKRKLLKRKQPKKKQLKRKQPKRKQKRRAQPKRKLIKNP